MYGKHFASMYTGSMIGAGAHVFAVWGYAIAHARNSAVELNPKLLAALIGSTTKEMQDAIDFLCAPDPSSRSQDYEGRRLVKEGAFQYLMPSHERYRAMRDEEDRREYNRVKKREERDRRAAAGVL